LIVAALVAFSCVVLLWPYPVARDTMRFPTPEKR
jgi:hypothetical protein